LEELIGRIGAIEPPTPRVALLYSAPDLARVIDRATRLSRSWEVNKRPSTFPKAA
jgi:hypothetical protein